ncbi:T9SS type A sorting domain-containing protein, partial [uncultured Pontibacter sp.]|uniref:T9SS type A sorting domain-containing protein n=1 Tax=uncultured Pontibacter sp. TaxID=453356 RepID=UPI002622F70B
YSGSNGTGTAGTPLTITFTVVDRESTALTKNTLQEQRSPEAIRAAYVYPNPSSDGRVKLAVFSENHEQLQYSLVNSIGERLYSGTLTKEASSNHVDFDFSEKMKAPGVYFLRVEGPSVKRVFKLMKTL